MQSLAEHQGHRFYDFCEECNAINPLKVFLQHKTSRGLISAVWLLPLIATQSHATSFQVQKEHDTDTAWSFEAFYLIYNSFRDLLSNTIASSGFSPLNVNGAYSTTGLAYDGVKGGNGVVPEPSAILLFGTGIVGLVAWRWEQKDNPKRDVTEDQPRRAPRRSTFESSF